MSLSADGLPRAARRLGTAVLRGCAKSGVKRVRVHILLDGRDVPDGSSVAAAEELQKVCVGHALRRRNPEPHGTSRLAAYLATSRARVGATARWLGDTPCA